MYKTMLIIALIILLGLMYKPMLKRYYQWFYEPLVIHTINTHACPVADSAIHINSYDFKKQLKGSR